MRPVRMPVRQLIGSCGPHVRHRAIETQCHPGQGMIGIDNYLIVGDVRHSIDKCLVGTFLGSLELHTHHNIIWKQLEWFHPHEFAVIFAKESPGSIRTEQL